jgi:uncharacterized lipoprotein YddW (UPF0748 family)
MDDYFYPDPGAYSNLNDSVEFRAYGTEYATLDSFRFANVNKVIKRIHETVKQVKPGAIFSVSPTSSISYNKTLYADVVKWYDNEWVDAIIPQIYSATGALTSTTSFNRLANDWNQFYKTKAALLVGHYLSRVGDGTTSTFSAQEIVDQFKIVRRQSGVKGSLLFSAKCFFDNNGHGNLGIIDILKTDIFKNPAVRPFMGRKTVNDPTVTSVSLSGSTLSWSAASGLNSVVYVIPDGETKAQVAAITAANTYSISVKGKYFVTTVNKDNVESEKSNEVEYI